MRLERLSVNKIKYSITFEELTCKGFMEEEMLKESFLWDALFDEMLDEASRLYKLESYDAVSIEIYSLTSNELILILTLDETELTDSLTMNISEQSSNNVDFVIVEITDFNECIRLVKSIIQLKHENLISSLFTYQTHYHLAIKKVGFINKDALFGICEEYGNISNVSMEVLEEYGKAIINHTAIQTIDHYF